MTEGKIPDRDNGYNASDATDYARRLLICAVFITATALTVTIFLFMNFFGSAS